VHDGVSPAERLLEQRHGTGFRDVTPHPGDAVVRGLAAGGWAAADADDRPVRRGDRQVPEQRRADVAAGTGDRDPHAGSSEEGVFS
jgi:hypothetical protein